MRTLTEIIVHCSATRPEWMIENAVEEKAAEIRRWHVDGNGWADIGYHYLVDRDGSICAGRPIERDGAHCKGRNKGTIGIALVGGFGSSENDKPLDNYTHEQLAALRTLIGKLQNDHRTITKVSGHNEYAAKACPGFKVGPWLNDKPARTSLAQSSTLKAVGAVGASGATVVGSAVGSLDGTAQVVLIIGALAMALGLLWIARERVKKWAKGDR